MEKLSVKDVHERESLKDFAARVRSEKYSNSRTLYRAVKLACAVRRAAQAGVDPDYVDALLEFDKELEEAMRSLARIVHLLLTIRERVDKAKIEEERLKRASIFMLTNARKNALKNAHVTKIPMGASGRKPSVNATKKMIEGLTPAQLAQLRAMILGSAGGGANR